MTDHLAEVLDLSPGRATSALSAANLGIKPTRPTKDGRILLCAPPSGAGAVGGGDAHVGAGGLAYRAVRNNGGECEWRLEALRTSVQPRHPKAADKSAADDDAEEEEEEEEEEDEFEPSSATLTVVGSTTIRIPTPDEQTSDHAHVVNIAASSDGRMVAVVLSSGDLLCYDATATATAAAAADGGSNSIALSVRWTRPRASGRTPGAIPSSARARYQTAGVAMGPVHTLSFCAGGYKLCVVDGSNGRLSVYDCAAVTGASGGGTGTGTGKGGVVVGTLGNRNGDDDGPSTKVVVSAAWSPYASAATADHVAVGYAGGDVAVYALPSAAGGSNELIQVAELGNLSALAGDDEEEEEEAKAIDWAATHLDWLPTTGGDGNNARGGGTLAVGYCKVVPDPYADEEEEEEDDDDNDEDCDADHRSKLVLVGLQTIGGSGSASTSYQTDDMADLEEVVPYFSVPKYGRHVYYTSFVRPTRTTATSNGDNADDGTAQLLLVGSNVSSDIVVVGRVRENGRWGEWTVLDLQEGSALTCPVGGDDGDEFAFPCGFVSVSASPTAAAAAGGGDGRITVLISATDGSITPHVLERRDDHDGSFGRAPASALASSLQAVPVEAAAAPAPFAAPASEPSPAPATSTAPASSAFPSMSAAAPKNPFSASKPAAAAASAPAPAPAPASIFGGGSAAPAFGSGSAPAFGSGSAPDFGSGSAPAFGSGSAPAFGSGSAPAFGSGSAPAFCSSFGSNAAQGSAGGGFAALASSPAKPAAFGGLGGAAATSGSSGFSFGSTSARTDPSMVKPLFGAAASAPRDTSTADAADDESDNESAGQGSATSGDDEEEEAPAAAPAVAAQQEIPATEDNDEVYPDDLIGTAETARTAYDEIAEGAASLPSSRFDDLLDVVGEGFYGDEKDEQLYIIDPNSTGTITKKAFMSWYVNFVTAADADGDDSASLDTADREEREEERLNADQTFTDTVGEGVDVIDSAAFGDLIESMGTTYCEEEHRRTIKKISGADGKITREAFVAWYLDWLFGGDESDIETDEDDEAGEEEETPPATSGEGWGNAFGVEEGSWKCGACMVRNKAADTKCAACETVRPGYEDKQEESGDGAAASGSAIGTGGFSFGGAAAAAPASSIGSGGFSFGGATTPAPASAASSGGGFSFGAKPSSAAPASTTGGFSFGSPPASKEGDSTPEKKAGGGFRFAPSTSSSRSDAAPATGSFQFGSKVPDKVEKKDEKTAPSSSASFPPLATKAPIPFSASSKASAPAPAPAAAKPVASSSAFPPMSTAAPKNPFSASKAAAPATKPAAASISAFPPMSTAAPKNPFSATTKAPAPAAAATAPASSISAFPPMSTAAPKNPFSATAAAPAPAAKLAASAAFPPLSTKAPKPFGGGAGTAAAKASDTKPAASASSAFPPMASKAPTPFSASSQAPVAAAKKSAAAGFPPMSAAAPKNPFAGTSAPAPASVPAAKPAASSAFPPMSAVAPKSPFSTAASDPAPAAKPTAGTASSAFPPMSKAAPINLFGASKPAPAPAPATASTSVSGFAFDSSAASKSAPAPGGSGGGFSFGSAPAPAPANAVATTKAAVKPTPPSTAAVPTQTPKSKADDSSSSSTALVVPKYEAATEYEAELWRGVMDFDKSLSSINELAQSLSDTKLSKDNADLEKKIERMIDTCDQARSMAMSVDTKVATQSDRAIFLLSRKDDLQRQVSEAERLVNEQLRAQEGGNLLRDQPLDPETEKIRRHLASSALETQHSIANVKDRLCLLRDILQAREAKPSRSAFSFGSPRNAPDQKLKAQRSLKQSVLRGYERAQQLSKTAEDLQKRVKEAADAIPGTSGASAPTSARKSRSRIAPLPVNFASPTAVAKRQAQKKAAAATKETEDIGKKQAAVENTIRNLSQSQHSISVKKFSRRGVIGSDANQLRDASASDWRSKGATSQLMNSTTATPLPKMGALVSVAAATPSASTPLRSLFTPPPASSTGKGRSADWNAKADVDLPKFNSLQASLQMPSTVKTITSEDAARKALQPFGTDPEKTAKAQTVKAREGREAAAAPTPALSETKIPSTIKKPSTAATSGGFPPMSSAAPTPFSLKSGDGGDKKKADAFPPMSLTGPSPSPFGAPAAAKKDDDAPSGLTPKAASGSATKKDSGSLTSGNLFGLTRPDSAKKDAEAKPFGGGGGSGISGFGGALGGALGRTADAASTPSKPGATDIPDYSALLTDFFNKHNPSKVGNVDKVLTKYKGQEEKLFRTLAHKYGVANPLKSDASSTSAATPSATTAGGLASPPLSLSSVSTPASSKPTISASPFGAPAATPPPPLAAANGPVPAPAPAAAGSGPSDYRTILTNFYQQHKPSQVDQVDKLLAKYNGREPEMFAKLATKCELRWIG